jgi:hypothetical protein
VSDIHCDYENAAFPEAQFQQSAIYGQVHNVIPLHTIAGDLVSDPDDQDIPGGFTFPAGDGDVIEVPEPE